MLQDILVWCNLYSGATYCLENTVIDYCQSMCET